MNTPPAPSRSDGTQARRRLLDTALRLFAEKGYQKTSTREITEAAEVNLGAISYYFGDKPGLYRAVFCESFLDADQTAPPDPCTCLPDFLASGLDTRNALIQFFRNFLKPLSQGEQIRLVMRLHFRELVEPSGVMGEAMNEDMGGLYQALLALVVHSLHLPAGDPDAARLTHALFGLSIHFFVTQDLVQLVSPELVASADAIDVLAERFALYAFAMIEAESRRRNPERAP